MFYSEIMTFLDQGRIDLLSKFTINNEGKLLFDSKPIESTGGESSEALKELDELVKTIISPKLDLLTDEVETIKPHAHGHTNIAVLDKFTVVNGDLFFNNLNMTSSIGDMKKETYDTNSNGIVDRAESLYGCKLSPSQINGFYDLFNGVSEELDTVYIPKINALDELTKFHSDQIGILSGDITKSKQDISDLNTQVTKNSTDVTKLTETSHSHNNGTILAKFSENSAGNIQYNGVDIVASGSGDMKKDIYDTNNDGVVDRAETLKGMEVSVEQINKIVELDDIKTSLDQIQNKPESINIVATNELLPTSSVDNLMYIVLNNKGTNTPCIYLGKNKGYIDLFEALGGDIVITPIPGEGDMLRSTYDTNKNGVVDKAETLVGLDITVDDINRIKVTVDQMLETINKSINEKINQLETKVATLLLDSHIHLNMSTIKQLSERNGDLYYNDINISNPSGLDLKLVGDMKKEDYDKDNDGIVDKAKTLNGLQSTIAELNQLTGVKSNLQQQINALKVGYQIVGTVKTFTELKALDINMITMGEAYIVEVDETKDGQKTSYVRGSNDWTYLGVFEVKSRDFETKPINLSTETTGTLQDSKLPATIARTSQLHTHQFTDSEIVATMKNIHIHKNFNLLQTITKTESNEILIDGVKVSCNVLFVKTKDHLPVIGSKDTLYIVTMDDTNYNRTSFYIYNTTYDRVLNDYIEGGTPQNGILNQVNKLNVVAPRDVIVKIAETKDFNLPDINVLKFKEGHTNITTSLLDFNVGDMTDFNSNDKIIFDGTLKPKVEIIKKFQKSSVSGKVHYSCTINKNDFEKLYRIEVI